MEFAKAAKNESNFTYTENAAVALKSTNSPLLDLFGVIGALRLKDYGEVSNLFTSAFNEDKLLAVKMMFYARNVRGGLGERETFRKMLRCLALSNPEIVIKNMEIIPFFGRYDDLYSLVDTKAENEMWAFLAWTIKMDLLNMEKGEPVSLCAKWLKSINTSSKNSVELGRETAKQFHMSEKEYRHTLSSLREYIKVTERKMSAQDWDTIPYAKVPSYAMKKYRNAFKKHDEARFDRYITNVSEGKEKINSATLFPYDILVAGNLTCNPYLRGNDYFSINADPVLEEQWKALPNYIKEGINALVMCDTSGSMEAVMNGLPMAISVSLAIYFAERNKGAYKDLFLTFSEHPEFIRLKGKTLKEKVGCVESIVANTDLEAAMDLILDVATRNHVLQDEMPKALIVISDMQFDAATRDRSDFWSSKPSKKQTFHDSMKQKFSDAGYVMPTVIYWQVCARSEAFQAKEDDKDIMLVSGASASTFKSIINNIGKTPWESMLQILNDEMYSIVKI